MPTTDKLLHSATVVYKLPSPTTQIKSFYDSQRRA